MNVKAIHGVLAGVVVSTLAGCAQPSDPGGVQSFVTSFGARVEFTTPDQPFTVNAAPGASVQDYWCAAGDYATRVASPTTRIYVVDVVKAGDPAVFSLVRPANGGAPTGLATIGGDNSVSAASAKSMCPGGRDG